MPSSSRSSSFIEINALYESSIQKEFFIDHCLRKNLPCIFRNLKQQSLLRVDKIEKCLSWVEKIVCGDNNDDEDNDEAFQSFLNDELLSQSASSSSSITMNEVQSIKKRIRESRVDVEVSFREYKQMTLSEFCRAQKGLLLFLTLPLSKNDHHQEENGKNQQNSWYLKDWHFVEWFQKDILLLQSSSVSPFYELPDFMKEFAQDDILQQFQRSKQQQQLQDQRKNGDDVGMNKTTHSRLPVCFGKSDAQEYKFVYAGGRGSATLPHFDVCATYSWSLNLSGKKIWKFSANREVNEKFLEKYFFAGGQEAHRRQQMMMEEGKFDKIEDLKIDHDDKDDDDRKKKNNKDPTTIITVEQNPGDLIFVPSLWVHEVRNITPCVSVNHNWYSFPYSVPHILRLVSAEVDLTLKMIGEETAAIFKKDSVEEWKLLFNLTQQGSNNWCLNVVKELFGFARSQFVDEARTKDEDVGMHHKNDLVIKVIHIALDKIEVLEQKVLM